MTENEINQKIEDLENKIKTLENKKEQNQKDINDLTVKKEINEKEKENIENQLKEKFDIDDFSEEYLTIYVDKLEKEIKEKEKEIENIEVM